MYSHPIKSQCGVFGKLEFVLRLCSRARLSSQRASLQTRRAIIIRSLERIFPIEPTSPSTDLLFTIVGVPLPIPSNPTDPAPPLHDPKHPDVNEDSTASALGYAAQVVNLLAFYLGHILPYPMTCANSRSLVKDPISSMHGPRMCDGRCSIQVHPY